MLLRTDRTISSLLSYKVHILKDKETEGLNNWWRLFNAWCTNDLRYHWLMLPKDTLYCFAPKGSSIKTLLLSQVDDGKDKTLRWELSFWFRGHLRGWLGHSLFMLDISRMKKFIDRSATESLFRRGGGNAQAGRQHRDSSEWALLSRGRPRCVFTFVTYFIIMSGDNRIKIIHAYIPY